MDSPDLLSIGFEFPGWDALTQSIFAAGMKGYAVKPHRRHRGLYTDPSGARISIVQMSKTQAYAQGAVVGHPGHHVRAFMLRPGLAHVELLEGSTVANRFLAEIDDPHSYPTYPLSTVGEPAVFDDYHLGALSLGVRVFADLAEWEAVHHIFEDDDEAASGPHFLRSHGLFALYTGEKRVKTVDGRAKFRGVCEGVTIRVNTVTGQEWYRVLVDCGFTIALALPGNTDPRPEEGSVIEGYIAMVGSSGCWDREAKETSAPDPS